MRWSTTLTELRVDVIGTERGRVEVARAGHGPAVLLVHGLPGSWRQAIPLAEDLIPDFTAILPSRPGYGSTPISSGRTYDQQADLYAAILGSLGIERCSIIGISGGGPSAVAFAVRHPRRTAGLVLSCAFSAHLMDRPKPWHPVGIPGLAEALSPVLRGIARRKLRRPGSVDAQMQGSLTADELERAKADPRIREDLVRHVLSHQEAPAGIAGMRNDLAQLRSASREPPDLSAITCPALVQHGSADEVVRPTNAEFYAHAIRGARLSIYDDAGHVFLFTRRSEAIPEIVAFLRGV